MAAISSRSPGVRSSDVLHPARHGDQQRLYRSTDDRNGGVHRCRVIGRGAFVLGLGSSHKAQVGPVHGITYSKPLTHVDGGPAALRDGQVQLTARRSRSRISTFWYTPRHRAIPIYLSAVFQKGIALCVEIGDGIILTRSTLQTAPTVRTHRRGGAPCRARSIRYGNHLAAADRRCRDAGRGACGASPGRGVLCRILSTL